jgi:SAM-dependent methyltransferase
MNFSKEWDERYREGGHLSQWPWSDLVSYVFQYAPPRSHPFRVLELGCGAGANIPFFHSLGVNYCAIEGSGSVVARLHERFPEFSKEIVEGDFTDDFPFPGKFDLVVDRASLTCNNTQSIRGCLDRVHACLRPMGVFIGIDWYSTEHAEFRRGRRAEDLFTRTDYRDGQFTGVGRVHYADRAHLEGLFAQFEILSLDHKVLDSLVPASGGRFAAWNIAVRKNERRGERR